MMRKVWPSTLMLLATAALAAPAHAATAAPGGIRGVLYDATCGSPCVPTCLPPPCHAGALCPLPAPGMIACPVLPGRKQLLCTAIGCPPLPFPPPLYTGAGAHVVARKLGAGRIVARRAPTNGHFSMRLPAGRYVVKAHVSKPCWKGETLRATVKARRFTSLAMRVENGCVAHPYGGGRAAGG